MHITSKPSDEMEYVTKLTQALDLVLNDLPDLQDDTLMMKCLDSVKVKLNFENNNSSSSFQTSVTQYLRKILLDKILLNKIYRLSLIEKGVEIIQFFLELTSIYVEIFGYQDTEFLIATQDFLKFYLDAYLNVQFFTDPTICCSILGLLCRLYDQTISNKALPPDFISYFDIIIDTYIFNFNSIQTILQVNCKSIFVRKLYKQLLHKHLIHLIEEKLNNYSLDFERLNTLINNLGTKLSIEIRMHNLDIISNVIVHFLMHSKVDCQVMIVRYLFDFCSKFEFSSVSLECLLNTEHLINDGSIEAVTIIIQFELFQKLFDLNFFSGLEKKLPTFYRCPEDIFVPEVNKICDYFIGIKSIVENSSEAYSFTAFKKSSDLMFKFLIYFRLFLNKLGQISSIPTEKIRSHIDSLLLAPVNINFNADNQMILANYLQLINNKPLKWKETILKQSLSNLKLLLRKDTLELLSFITTENTTYILRNLLIDQTTKDMLLSLLVDYYKKTEKNCQRLTETCDVLINSLKLKINNQFNVNVFKLISMNLKYFNDDQTNIQLVEIATQYFSQLMSELTAKSSPNQAEYFQEQFEIYLQFLIDCLNENVNNLVIVKKFLNSADFSILKICFEYLKANPEKNSSYLCNISGLEYIQSTIYEFFQTLFGRLNEASFSQINFICLFSAKFLTYVRNQSLTESEALVRRPCVKFQAKYYIYIIEENFKSDRQDLSIADYLRIFNHFSHLLISEFDWQIQVYCLEFFQNLWNVIFKHLDICGYKILLSNLQKSQISTSEPTVLELVFMGSDFFKSILSSYKDYDSSVVNLSAKVIFDLSKNKYFIDILEVLLEKDEAFWSMYYENLNAKIGEMEISGKSKLFEDFSNLVKTTAVENLIGTSNNTTDLYTINPLAVLDDLINSYQFHLEDETHIDCY